MGLRFLLLNGVIPHDGRTPRALADHVTAHEGAASLHGSRNLATTHRTQRVSVTWNPGLIVCLDGRANSCCAGECSESIPEPGAPPCPEGTSSN
ncbi:hypothetical protein EZV78_09615 [Cutibacterium avidum]|nr:hypothetical protein EZV78_09615 [Cutibacterium avidum]